MGKLVWTSKKKLLQKKCMGLQSSIFLGVPQLPTAEMGSLPCPTCHPKPWSHEIIHVEWEPGCFTPKRGQLCSQTWFLMALPSLVFKTSTDRDCTTCTGSLGSVLHHLHRKQDNKIQSIAHRATEHPGDESAFVEQLTS